MMWWIPIVIMVGGRILLNGVSKQKPKRSETIDRKPVLTQKGSLHGDKILVIGRTGAGKSTLINLLKGEDVLPVGDIGSTTRCLEGVEVRLEDKTVVLIDTPGIGEALTSDSYHSGILDWYRCNQSSVRSFLLVLQADTKAHADDKRLLDELIRNRIDARLVIAIAQADKMKPMVESFQSTLWEVERQRSSSKCANIQEKIQEVARQFGVSASCVIPVAAKSERSFNVQGVRTALQLSMRDDRERKEYL